nr:centriolin isoform X2 [Solea senegalensis]
MDEGALVSMATVALPMLSDPDTEMEEQSEAGGGADPQENRGGIRFITEELLLKLTGCPSLSLVRSLNLSSSAGDKRIKFIENLHGCQHLQVLKLNHNVIQRMERLNTLSQLRELQLAHNNIQKIEGLEHLSNLRHLNLSYNRIGHIPMWLGKRLQSLCSLHLQHNLITSLYEVSRLRSLKSLSELSVIGNPASSLTHSRLFLLYHLRTLDRLDDLPVSQEERGHAYQRFNTEELERLQWEVDSSQSQLSRLQLEQQAAITQLHQQEETNQTLTAQTQKQQHAHTLLEQELHTKSQLLEKTTAELTRAFHRLYELEQELTFYKLDTKLSPLPYCSSQGVDAVAESPYIGKARHIRNTITSTPRNSFSSSSPSPSLQSQEGSDAYTDLEMRHPLLNDCRTQQNAAEAELPQIAHQTEKQLQVEFKVVNESTAHVQQEALLCHVISRVLVLQQLRDKAEDTQRQMERWMTETQRDELKTQDNSDPQHLSLAHVTTVQSTAQHLLYRMSRSQGELEGRLDDMLSRIALEAQEIKELEQQLTDGQILANEALQKDLKGIICGLQEYLRGLREQARHAQQQVHSLQDENQSLQLHLDDTQRHCKQLEHAARTHTQEMSVQQQELSMLQMETQALRDRQVESSRQQAELEEELEQLREELNRQVTLGQLEHEAMQAAVEKEKGIGGVKESQLQSIIDTLQEDKSSVQYITYRLQVQLDHTTAELHQTRTQFTEARAHLDWTRIKLDQFTEALLDNQGVQIGTEELSEDSHSLVGPEDMLSRSVERLFRTLQQTRTSRDQMKNDHNYSQQLIATLQTQLAQNQNHITQLEAQLETQGKDQVSHCVQQDQETDWKLKEDLQRLREQLQRSYKRNRHLELELEQNRLHLEEVQQQKDTLLQQRTDEEVDGSSHQDKHMHTVEELNADLAEAQRHTHRLRQQLDQDRNKTKTRNRSGTRPEEEGKWCYIPPGHSVHSMGSQGTQDSGLGLQYLSSPERGQHQGRPPSGGGYWVYIPTTNMDSDRAASECRDSRGDSDTDRHTTGGAPPHHPSPPDPAEGISVDFSHCHTPLVGPAWLLCGSPVALVSTRTPGGSALHCNVPEHRDTEEKLVCECLHTEAERLDKEKKKLRLETKQIRHTLRRHRSVLQVCDEVECVEKTLLKRRAELRQADKLLLEAQSCIHNTRDQASSAQWEANEWQRRAQDSATCLQEATQQVGELQEEVEDLRRRKQKVEQTVSEVGEVLKNREKEFQQLGTKIRSATDRLSNLLSDCQEAQKGLDSIHTQVEQQEQRLVQRREEHQTALNRVKEVREEEQQLQRTVKELLEQQEVLLRQKRSTVTAVKEDEQKLLTLQSEIHTHRAELKEVLQELLAEQQALEKVKTKHTQSSQRLHVKKDELDRVRDELDTMMDKLDRERGEVDRTQAELDGIKEEVENRKSELGRTQQDVDRKVKELYQVQEEVDRKKRELAGLQQEMESHIKEAESFLKQMKQQQTELQELQEKLSRTQEEKKSLQEQCKHLEARRRHADRCLSAVEVELAKQREEHSHAQLLKQEVVRDTAATKEQLNENSELLSMLNKRVEERKKQLLTLEQEEQHRAGILKELQEEVEHKQAVCRNLEEVQTAVCRLEDRGRHLQQFHQLSVEVQERERKLLHKEEGLNQQRQELQVREEELNLREAELLCLKGKEMPKKQEELHEKEQELDHSRGMLLEDDESFSLSTAGPISALSPQISGEEERWKAELQREQLRQQEDRLKARLRCSLWKQQETLKVRRLETEDSLLGLRDKVDKLDSLLSHSH